MEICDAVVMFLNIPPYFQGMAVAAVKGSVNQLHLRRPFVQKKLQLPFHCGKAAQPHPLIYGRKTIPAPERTSSAGLVIYNSVFKVL